MEGLNLFESNILLWIQENLRTDALDVLMPYVSGINNAGILAILTVALLLVLRKYRRVGITALFSLGTEFIIVNLLIKGFVARVRPYIANEALLLLGKMPKDYSFPSGHTGSAFAVATVMLLCREDVMPNKCGIPRKYGIFAVGVAILIAISRMYNAAHYPTDVLAGMVIGMLTGVLAHRLVYIQKPVCCTNDSAYRQTGD